MDFIRNLKALACRLKNLNALGVQLLKNTEQLAQNTKMLTAINEKLDNLVPMIRAQNQHREVFTEYRNCHQGREVVLLASGPSVKKYEPIPNAVHVGVNYAFLYEKVKLNYMFLNDYNATHQDMWQKIDGYQGDRCVKFFGIFPDNSLAKLAVSHNISDLPPKFWMKPNVKRFFVEEKLNHKFAYDLASEPLGDFCSTVFIALQFILYTNPKRVYLVGCDCDSYAGHFYDNKSSHFKAALASWEYVRDNIQKVYPSTEFVSINPVNLKGFFRDLYTV